MTNRISDDCADAIKRGMEKDVSAMPEELKAVLIKKADDLGGRVDQALQALMSLVDPNDIPVLYSATLGGDLSKIAKRDENAALTIMSYITSEDLQRIMTHMLLAGAGYGAMLVMKKFKEEVEGGFED
jgi:hypothetical protein